MDKSTRSLSNSCWICDSCGEIIDSTEEGWVEWIEDGQCVMGYRGRGLRLVHNHSSCSYSAQGYKDHEIIGALVSHYLGAGVLRLAELFRQRRLSKREIMSIIERL